MFQVSEVARKKLSIAEVREFERKRIIGVSSLNPSDPCFVDCVQKVYRSKNSLYVTLGYTGSANIEMVDDLWQVFVAYATHLAGLSAHQVAAQGFALFANSAHVHAVLYSVKDRKTGRGIVDLNKAQRDELSQFWNWEIKGNDYTDTVDIKSVWGPSGLITYFAGDNNIGCPGQQVFMLPAINPKLLKKKLKQRS